MVTCSPTIIDEHEVSDLYRVCLSCPNDKNDRVIVVHGLILKASFSRNRLRLYLDEIRETVSRLPRRCHKSYSGKRGSWRDMRKDRNYTRWASNDRVVDEIICLALATGMMKCFNERIYIM